MAPPLPPSACWWLLFPVILILRRLRSTRYHRTVLRQISEADRERCESFIDKATGWFVVATQGALIAFKESGENGQRAWPGRVTVIVAMLAICGGDTLWQARRHQRAAR